MIGMELLQLLQGDPLAQMRMGPQPAPNPNPQAPPPQQVSAPRATPPLYPTDPKTGLVVGGPGSGLPPSYERQPNGTYMPPGGIIRDAGPAPQRGLGPNSGPFPQVNVPPTVGNAIAGPGNPPGPQAAPPPPNPLPQSGPPSVASQSPPDLVNLYMRLMQQQRAGSAIDHGLALMASAYAAPGTQGQIMHSMDNQQQDPSAMMGNLVQLQQMQNMQNSRPAIVAALTGGVGDGSSGGVGGLPANVVNSLPTDTLLKMLDQRQQAAIQLQQKQAEAGIDVTKQGALTSQTELKEAQDKAPGQLSQISQMDQLASSLNTSAIGSIMSSPLKRAAAMKLLQTDPKEAPGAIMTQIAAAGLSSDEQAALQQLKQLDNQVYGEAFQSTGSKRTQAEVQNLRNGASPLQNFNQPFDAYMKQFGNFQTQLHKSYNNVLGAAGRADEVPDASKWDMSDPNNPKPLMDTAYLPNGNMYAGKGGAWASSPPKSNFDYAAIPSGTVYTAPDGTQRKKP